jgi:hypothetical protein
MKIIKLIGSYLIIVLTLVSCETESDNPELYGEYLTVEIASVNENVLDSVFQIQIFNSHDKVFEKDCNLIFSLTNKTTGKIYSAEENIVNKRISDDPSLGYLNLQGGGQFTKVSYLNQLEWTGKAFNEIEDGIYDIQVTLFIDDHTSPNNLIHSNKLLMEKN